MIILRKYEKVGYIFVLPAVLFMLIFVGYPIIYNIILSFQNVTLMNLGGGDREFIFFKNYANIFNDVAFSTALKNTFIFSIICIIFQFVIGFIFALFFNLKFKLAKFIRGLIMVSWLIPITVTALNFKYMFSIQGGIINEFLMNLHIIKEPIEWLINGKSALLSLMITNIWIGIPFNMILLVTGLSTIPISIYESSNIDGANWVQRLMFITIPSIKMAIMAVLTLGFIYTFKVFDLVFIMTNGGPVNSTEMLSTLSYRYAFDQFNFGKGAAVANILCLILLFISMIYIKYIKENEEA